MITFPPKVHTVVASLHPAFAMRGVPQFYPLIRTAIARAERWAGREDGPEKARGIRVTLDPTPDALHVLLTGIKGQVAVDVETPEDSPTTITICGVAFSDTDVVAFPWTPDHADVMREFLAQGNLKVGHNFAFDQHAFNKQGTPVAWPMADTIQAAALLWPPFREARSRPWLSLPLCVTRVFDATSFWKNPENFDTKALYRTMFPHVHVALYPQLYCALDCVFTFRLWRSERVFLEMDGMWDLFTGIVAPAAPVLVKMEERGIPVDEVRRKDLVERTEKRIEELNRDIRRFAHTYHQKRIASYRGRILILQQQEEAAKRGRSPCRLHPEYIGLTKRSKCAECEVVYAEGADLRKQIKTIHKEIAKWREIAKRISASFDPNKDDSWRWLLYDPDGLNLSPPSRTPKGKPRVDDQAIEILSRRHNDISVLQSRVELQHALHRLRTTLSIPVDEKGRAYFTYSMHRTETGRLASGADAADWDRVRKSAGGNAQNVRKLDRQIFCASSPDHCLVQADWSQIEIRVLAWLARELKMIEAFEKGLDIHALNAAAIYGCAPEDARTHQVLFEGRLQPARDAGKTATHKWDYGGGDITSAKIFGVSIEEAARARRAYLGAYLRLAAFQDETIQRVEKDRCLINPFGRKLRFYNFGNGKLLDREEALAFLPQSTVGDMCKAVLPFLDRLPGAMLTTTHDSFLFDIRKSNVGSLISSVRGIMEKEWPELGEIEGHGYFRCPADFEVGGNWGVYHKCDPTCPHSCDKGNLEGLRPWGGGSP